MPTVFTKLNHGWNAEPNAPEPTVRVSGDDVILRFAPNPFVFPEYESVSYIELVFEHCARYRLGPTNDEGWYRGQCRFSELAPGWGEFYEVRGDLRLDELDQPWTRLATADVAGQHHYLFYFRDETFECDASSWKKRDVA